MPRSAREESLLALGRSLGAPRTFASPAQSPGPSAGCPSTLNRKAPDPLRASTIDRLDVSSSTTPGRPVSEFRRRLENAIASPIRPGSAGVVRSSSATVAPRADAATPAARLAKSQTAAILPVDRCATPSTPATVRRSLDLSPQTPADEQREQRYRKFESPLKLSPADEEVSAAFFNNQLVNIDQNERQRRQAIVSDESRTFASRIRRRFFDDLDALKAVLAARNARQHEAEEQEAAAAKSVAVSQAHVNAKMIERGLASGELVRLADGRVLLKAHYDAELELLIWSQQQRMRIIVAMEHAAHRLMHGSRSRSERAALEHDEAEARRTDIEEGFAYATDALDREKAAVQHQHGRDVISAEEAAVHSEFLHMVAQTRERDELGETEIGVRDDIDADWRGGYDAIVDDFVGPVLARVQDDEETRRDDLAAAEAAARTGAIGIAAAHNEEMCARNDIGADEERTFGTLHRDESNEREQHAAVSNECCVRESIAAEAVAVRFEHAVSHVVTVEARQRSTLESEEACDAAVARRASATLSKQGPLLRVLEETELCLRNRRFAVWRAFAHRSRKLRKSRERALYRLEQGSSRSVLRRYFRAFSAYPAHREQQRTLADMAGPALMRMRFQVWSTAKALRLCRERLGRLEAAEEPSAREATVASVEEASRGALTALAAEDREQRNLLQEERESRKGDVTDAEAAERAALERDAVATRMEEAWSVESVNRFRIETREHCDAVTLERASRLCAALPVLERMELFHTNKLRREALDVLMSFRNRRRRQRKLRDQKLNAMTTRNTLILLRSRYTALRAFARTIAKINRVMRTTTLGLRGDRFQTLVRFREARVAEREEARTALAACELAARAAVAAEASMQTVELAEEHARAGAQTSLCAAYNAAIEQVTASRLAATEALEKTARSGIAGSAEVEHGALTTGVSCLSVEAQEETARQELTSSLHIDFNNALVETTNNRTAAVEDLEKAARATTLVDEEAAAFADIHESAAGLRESVRYLNLVGEHQENIAHLNTIVSTPLRQRYFAKFRAFYLRRNRRYRLAVRSVPQLQRRNERVLAAFYFGKLLSFRRESAVAGTWVLAASRRQARDSLAAAEEQGRIAIEDDQSAKRQVLADAGGAKQA